MAIVLPEPDAGGTKSLVECTRNRRSIREYSDSPISLLSLSRLLWAAQGITGNERKRTTPSAGGLYPLHIRFIARQVKGLESGLYDYRGDNHSLQHIGNLPSSESAQAVGIGDQPWLADSAIVIGVAANFAIPVKHFGLQPPLGERGKRYVYMEAGALAQNVHLHATDLELGCVLVAGFDDGRAREVLQLPSDLAPVALICVGGLDQ